MDNIEGGGTHNPEERVKSIEREEKERRWNQVSNELSHVTDALGKPIDKGIFDTVVALKLLDFHTSQSCEGHHGRGVPAPWVEIQAPVTNEMKALKERFSQTMEAIETFEIQGKSDDELEELYQQYHKLSAEVRRPQLEEIRKIILLIGEFYQNRQVAYDQMLTMRGNRLESQGAQLQEIIPPEEQNQKFHAYQEEMKTFTGFLKKKYFSEGNLH